MMLFGDYAQLLKTPRLAGKEVTARSDIYALGIVLHELLAGKRPPREHFEPGNAELDPAVERVILRCLKPDPQTRPATALSVAAALPGGGPLAAALAAGDTCDCRKPHPS